MAEILHHVYIQILCLHGGIPHPSLGNGLLSDINEIPNMLPNPEVDSLLAWELMWNDPIRDEDITEEIAEELLQGQGYIENVTRATGHLFR